MSPDLDRVAAQIVSPLPDREKLHWVDLSFRTAYAAARLHPCQINGELEAAAQSAGQSPVAPAYRLWMAENMCREGQDHESLKAFDDVTEAAARSARLTGDPDFAAEAMAKKAEAATRVHNVGLAIQTYRNLVERTGRKDILFKAGLVAEKARRLDEAADLYQAAITAPPTLSAVSRSELARRALARLNDRQTLLAPHPEPLCDQLVNALNGRDGELLRRLMSRTHFFVGMAGGEFRFENEDILEYLLSELGSSQIVSQGVLQGSGMKRYLLTGGWQGQWFRGTVVFMFCEGPRGWELSGVALHEPGQIWKQQWAPKSIYSYPYTPPYTPPEPYTLPIEIKAPWPKGRNMRAGGLIDFGIKSASIAAAGFPWGAILAETYASSACGFGPGGFYYGQGPTHDEESEYAIDFTRYRRFVPLDNESGGVPVLAVAAGRVLSTCDTIRSGDSSDANEVLIIHVDPETGRERFVSRYMHMKGPSLIGVSAGMAVQTGTRLGLINDTGTSVYDHLHFSMHDQDNLYTPARYGCGGVQLGHSVPPSPMDGNRPSDGECMESSNVDLGPILTPPSPPTPPPYYVSGASFAIGIDII
jgi:hypothetical protein